MSSFVITDGELDALYGAGPLAFTLYVWLRSWMDFDSGLVGLSRPISLGMLGAYGERHISRGSGQQIKRPTPKEVRMALEVLVSGGLLVRSSNPESLVFRMPLASVGKVRPKQTGQSSGTGCGQGTGHGESGAGACVEARTGQGTGHGSKGRTGHTSEVRENPGNNNHHHNHLSDLPGGGDDGDGCSAIPEIPTSPVQWFSYFNAEHGTRYDPMSVWDRRKLWPIFAAWVKAGISVGLVNGAVARAKDSATEPIVHLPVYVDRMLSGGNQSGGRDAKAKRRGSTIAGLTGGWGGKVIDVSPG